MCSTRESPRTMNRDVDEGDLCLGASAAPIPRGEGKKVLQQKAATGSVESGFQRSGLSTYGRATS